MTKKDKKYTINEIIERLTLTDEELLLCKQHRDYNKKLDDLYNEGKSDMDKSMKSNIRVMGYKEPGRFQSIVNNLKGNKND